MHLINNEQLQKGGSQLQKSSKHILQPKTSSGKQQHEQEKLMKSTLLNRLKLARLVIDNKTICKSIHGKA